MKEKSKGFITGFLVSALVFGLAGTTAATVASKTITADYNNIKVKLDGEYVILGDANGKLVEPFAVDGTTYLPVRAISDALGLDVGWDQSTSTVLLSSAGGTAGSDHPVELLGFYKLMEESFADMKVQFNGIANGTAKIMINEIVQQGPYAGMTFAQATVQKFSDALNSINDLYDEYSGFLTFDDVSLVTEYRRLNSLLISHMNTLSGGNQFAIENILGAATQAYADCTGNESAARFSFWANYPA